MCSCFLLLAGKAVQDGGVRMCAFLESIPVPHHWLMKTVQTARVGTATGMMWSFGPRKMEWRPAKHIGKKTGNWGFCCLQCCCPGNSCQNLLRRAEIKGRIFLHLLHFLATQSSLAHGCCSNHCLDSSLMAQVRAAAGSLDWLQPELMKINF